MPSKRQLANALRFLSIDAVQKANSGHPGMPMGTADIAEVLWNDFLKHNPSNPNWVNRDRFVLSNGHGVMLLYALLHVTGYALSISDIQNFRQLHAKTPGHPEYGITPGVEATTGPLGQGLANAVGMAIAEKNLAATFNTAHIDIVDHDTYVFLGDGCLMEGISHEAASLAGTLKLHKLIAIYDDNKISIDGATSGWFTDDTPLRFQAYGWHVIPRVDGHNAAAIQAAIAEARSLKDKPVLICCQTQIGFGAPHVAGTAKAHGSALGAAGVAAAREALAWHHPPFFIPDSIYEAWDARKLGAKLESAWQEKFAQYQKNNPALAQAFMRRTRAQLPKDWHLKNKKFIHSVTSNTKALATRQASALCLDHYAGMLPEMIGGSADLTPSNNTWHKHAHVFCNDTPSGNYLHYGVREFAMFAIMNGLALHGGFIPYGGTFLTFSDYGRNAIRLAALSHQRVIFVLTHDSIALGEDGPTHQPIEHAAILRQTPNVMVWRPANLTETAVAWQSAIENTQGPTCLLLSRQKLSAVIGSHHMIPAMHKGAYVLKESKTTPQAILIATGSEVPLALQAYDNLSAQGHAIRLVSMPATTVFDRQDAAYRESVLPSNIKTRLAVEAGVSGFWHKYVGTEGAVIGIDHYGLSAPGPDVYQSMGLSVQQIEKTLKRLMR